MLAGGLAVGQRAVVEKALDATMGFLLSAHHFLLASIYADIFSLSLTSQLLPTHTSHLPFLDVAYGYHYAVTFCHPYLTKKSHL